MEEKISKARYLTMSAIFIVMLLFNIWHWQSQTLGLALGLLYLFFYSFIFGSIFVAKRGWQLVLGFTFLLAFIAAFGALFIYAYEFNNYIYSTLIVLIPLLLVTPYYRITAEEKFSLKKLVKTYLEKFDQRRESKLHSLYALAYLALVGAAFYLLAIAQTNQSIQSPWEVVSPLFFMVYFLASLLLIFYLNGARRTKLPLLLLVIHSFLSTSVAVIIYRLGFGFDPFIHQATERIINETGTIIPKTPYYLGQYALVLFFHKLTFISIPMIDRLLVPVLFSLILPPTIFYVFSHWLEKRYALLLSLLFLLVPYTSFIMTAPQNLGNLFFIITILLSLLYFRNQIHVVVLYLLTLSTVAIHPLAGIPLFITVVLLNVFKLLYDSYRRYLGLYVITALAFTVFLPLAFILNGSGLTLDPDLKRADLYLIGWVNRFDLPLNLVYLVQANKFILALLITLFGLAYLNRHKLLRNNAAYIMAAFVIFVNFIITKYFLTFPALNETDAAPFVGRLLVLSFYVLLPFFLLGLYRLVKNFWEHGWFSRLFAMIMLGGLLTTSLYLSYPRLNQFEPAKFFSLSSSDIKAVQIIEQTASPNHIVLANQMVGVAAIKEFGFKRYINGQFYYSMPNGHPRTFYEAYLAMIYENKKRQTMEQIMDEAGVSEAYFVLNRYWRDAEKIAAQARQSADQVIDVDDGAVLIFKYTKE